MNLGLYNEVKQVEGGEDELVQVWMQMDSTKVNFENWLLTLDIDAGNTKKLLSIIYMNSQMTQVLSCSDHDTIMKKEVSRFYPILLRHLQHGTEVSFKDDVVRITRFYDAWSRVDKSLLKKFEGMEDTTSN